MQLTKRRPMWRRAFPVVLSIIGLNRSILAVESKDDHVKGIEEGASGANGSAIGSAGSSPNDLISLAESIRRSQIMFEEERMELLRNYWKNTFEEIKELTVVTPRKSKTNGTQLTEWKLLLDADDEETNSKEATKSQVPTPVRRRTRRKPLRFDGFPSWDRLLQQWADDVAEYLEENQNNVGEYPMSTFGRPRTISTNDEVKSEVSAPLEQRKKFSPNTDMTILDYLPIEITDKAQLPKPKSVQPGQEVLPHTDIADKSKRLWIVTTASLPWMTGTAVNPLLRAAYLTEGRKDANGAVTLMLPWLERRDDQERVYGKEKAFDTPEDQEAFIRTWLRDSAGLKEASEFLGIAWYPARQERAENSLYSMGDITALIPVRVEGRERSTCLSRVLIRVSG